MGVGFLTVNPHCAWKETYFFSLVLNPSCTFRHYKYRYDIFLKVKKHPQIARRECISKIRREENQENERLAL